MGNRSYIIWDGYAYNSTKERRYLRGMMRLAILQDRKLSTPCVFHMSAKCSWHVANMKQWEVKKIFHQTIQCRYGVNVITYIINSLWKDFIMEKKKTSANSWKKEQEEIWKTYLLSSEVVMTLAAQTQKHAVMAMAMATWENKKKSDYLASHLFRTGMRWIYIQAAAELTSKISGSWL